MPRAIKKPSRQLFKVSVRLTADTEDSFVAAITDLYGIPPSVYTDTERQTTVASLFLPEFSERDRRCIRSVLTRIAAAGLPTGSGRIVARRIARENWAESWKRHFKPLEIGSRLLVLPSWSKRKPNRDQTMVVLDPGLSFGTGHHPTTAFCLEQVAELSGPGHRHPSLLDIGTGSGILAIAAAKLGYKPVKAFDFDPAAVRVARQNAAVNRVSFPILRQDLSQMPIRSPKRYDVVCANLMYDLLIQERRRILSRLQPNGTLVLAGILKSQFPAVRLAYEEKGLTLIRQRMAGEWRSGAFQFQSAHKNSAE